METFFKPKTALKKNNQPSIFLLVSVFCCLVVSNLYSQSTTYYFDYTYANNLSGCNAFASPTIFDGYEHKTNFGHPGYNGSPEYSIGLKFGRYTSQNVLGTEYSITFPFKKDYKYKISTLSSSTTANTGVVALGLSVDDPGIYADNDCSSPPPPVSYPTIDFLNNYNTVLQSSSYVWGPPQIDEVATKDYNYLLVAGFPDDNYTGNYSFVYVRKIEIIETPPFYLSPATSTVSCGEQKRINFSLDNLLNIPGVTGYIWNLGSGNNGWLYNGNPAPSTINTGTSNVLSLVTSGTVAPSNVSVTVYVNNAVYNTYSARTTLTLPANMTISGPDIICNTANYFVNNLPAGATVTSWDIPSSAGPVLQLSPNNPQPNYLLITNQRWYSIITTLTATVNSCGTSITTPMKTIANDNDNSSIQYGNYYQQACSFYNVDHPSESGNLNGNAVFLHQGCMTSVNLYNMFGRTVTLAPGSGQPMYWSYSGPDSYGYGVLYLQLPFGSGGIPFTFNINGDGACYQKSLLFFSISNNGRFAFMVAPNPVKDILKIYVKNKERITINSKMNLPEKYLRITATIYDLNGNKLITKQSTGNYIHEIPVNGLNRGDYIVKIVVGSETQAIKFFKE